MDQVLITQQMTSTWKALCNTIKLIKINIFLECCKKMKIDLDVPNRNLNA